MLQLLVCFASLITMCISIAQGPYETLGLKRGTSQVIVKKQFRKLSLQYHPDKNSDPKVEGKYKEITDAYQTIVDGKADEHYDKLNGMNFNQRQGSRQNSYSYSYSSGNGQTTYTYYSSGGGEGNRNSYKERFNEYSSQFQDAFSRKNKGDGRQYQQNQRSQQQSWSLFSLISNSLYEVLRDPFVFPIILICMIFALLQIASSIVSEDMKQQQKQQRQYPTQNPRYTNINQGPMSTPTPR